MKLAIWANALGVVVGIRKAASRYLVGLEKTGISDTWMGASNTRNAEVTFHLAEVEITERTKYPK
jgi:hypothetical protein